MPSHPDIEQLKARYGIPSAGAAGVAAGPAGAAEEDTFVDDFIDSFRTASYYKPLMAIRSLLGDHEGAERIERQLRTDPTLQTSNAVAEFAGGVVGAVAPTLLAVAAPQFSAPVLAAYTAQAVGAGRKRYRDFKEERGEDLNTAEEWAVSLGFGASELIAERFGLKAFQKITTEGAKILGKGVMKGMVATNPSQAREIIDLGLKSIATGAGDESLAQVMQNAVSMVYDEDGRTLIGLARNVPAAALGGAAGGAFVGAAGTAFKRQAVRGENQDPSRQGVQQGVQQGAIPEDADIPIVDPSTFTDKVFAFARENLTARGNFPKDAFSARIKATGFVQQQGKRMTDTVGRFKGVVKDVYGGVDKMTDGQRRLINDALGGHEPDVPESMPEDRIPEFIRRRKRAAQQRAMNLLPEDLRAVVREMRGHVDALSTLAQQEGVVEGDLSATFDENKGIYLTRDYRAFGDPDWAKNVPEEVRNRFKSMVRKEFPDLTENQIEQQIGALLFQEDGPISAAGKVDSKDLSILKSRKNLSKELRALYGQYGDPLFNYMNSAGKLAHLVGSHRFLKKTREVGLGRFLWDKNDPNIPPEAVDQIAPEGSETMRPVSGLYTTPEIARAFKEMHAPQPTGALHSNYMRLAGAAKVGQTVFSTQAQARNFLGNIGTILTQGHINILSPRSWANSLRAVRFEVTGKESHVRVKRMVEVDDPSTSGRRWEEREVRIPTRDYVEHLVGLQIWNQEVQTSQAEAMLRESGITAETLDRYGAAGKGARHFYQFMQRLYQGGDDFWKMMAYESEFRRHRMAYSMSEKSDAEIAEIAADKVRNTLFNYAMLPKLAKDLRRNRIVAPFVAFPAEIIRTSANTARLIAEELKDPALRAIGARRLAGATLWGAGTMGAAVALRHVAGIDEEQDAALRRFMAPWERNSQIMYLGGGRGEAEFVNFSYTDPYEYIKDPVVAFLTSDDPQRTAREMVREFFEPFLGEELVTQKILDLARNQTDQGRQVYNEEDDFGRQVLSMTRHVADAFKPGVMRSAERIASGMAGKTENYGRARDPQREAITAFLGQKVQRLDVSQALAYKAYDFSRAKRQATAIFTQTARRRGRVSAGEVRQAHEAMERARKRLFEEAHLDARAALRWGLTERQVFETLREANVSKKDARAILTGSYVPYEGEADLFDEAEERARSASSEEDVLRSLRELRKRRAAL